MRHAPRPTPGGCSTASLKDLNPEVDSAVGMEAVVSGLGGTCASYELGFPTNNDVPNVDTSSNICVVSGTRDDSTYSCARVPAANKRRVCNCCPTVAPTAAPTAVPTALPTLADGVSLKITFTLVGVSTSEVALDSFQTALKATLSALTGIAVDRIVIEINFTRRDTSVTSTLQAASATEASTASSAITTAANDNSLTSSLSTQLAATSYAGSTVTAVNNVATSQTSNNEGGSGGDTSAWIYIGVAIGLAIVLGVGAAMLIYFYRKKRRLDRGEPEEPKPKAASHPTPLFSNPPPSNSNPLRRSGMRSSDSTAPSTPMTEVPTKTAREDELSKSFLNFALSQPSVGTNSPDWFGSRTATSNGNSTSDRQFSCDACGQTFNNNLMKRRHQKVCEHLGRMENDSEYSKDTNSSVDSRGPLLAEDLHKHDQQSHSRAQSPSRAPLDDITKDEPIDRNLVLETWKGVCPEPGDQIFHAIGKVLFARIFEEQPAMTQMYESTEGMPSGRLYDAHLVGVVRFVDDIVECLFSGDTPGSGDSPEVADLLQNHHQVLGSALLWLLQTVLPAKGLWTSKTAPTWQRLWTEAVADSQKESEIMLAFDLEAEFLRKVDGAFHACSPPATQAELCATPMEEVVQCLSDLVGITEDMLESVDVKTRYQYYLNNKWTPHLQAFKAAIKVNLKDFMTAIRACHHPDHVATALAERHDAWSNYTKGPLPFLESVAYGRPFVVAQETLYKETY
eukprot:TRINITY_DN2996_c0_g1_i1.p1 TRINITY_DN2996_c0_g1~~TRINITY_DN2996_c0_g1_i1.p1  ORF type:complete len:736 (+),score=107.09 TRINITY_DN2996_c0_g1_i1:918-3125(+)